MNVDHMIQYATLCSLLIGGLSVAVALMIHREEVKTQIFLTLSTRYDELLQSSSIGFWLTTPTSLMLPERTDELRMSILRFCTQVSLAYYLFREHRIPRRMWDLMLRSAEQKIRNPLFRREWEHLRLEFELFPEFVALVSSVQARNSATPVQSAKSEA